MCVCVCVGGGGELGTLDWLHLRSQRCMRGRGQTIQVKCALHRGQQGYSVSVLSVRWDCTMLFTPHTHIVVNLFWVGLIGLHNIVAVNT